MSKKSNTRTTICTSKCCHREIIERVIYPHLSACLRATLLLMASSFFLCSLYFPSDSGACFIVFCHVSVIAPTACLMLSRFFFVCVCVYVCACECVFLSPPTRAGCEFVGQNRAAGELHTEWNDSLWATIGWWPWKHLRLSERPAVTVRHRTYV